MAMTQNRVLVTMKSRQKANTRGGIWNRVVRYPMNTAVLDQMTVAVRAIVYPRVDAVSEFGASVKKHDLYPGAHRGIVPVFWDDG